MRSQIFSEFLLHHGFVIRPIDSVYLGDEARADAIQEPAVMKVCGILCTDKLVSLQKDL